MLRPQQYTSLLYLLQGLQQLCASARRSCQWAYVMPNMWSLPLTNSETQVLALFSAATAAGVLRLLESP